MLKKSLASAIAAVSFVQVSSFAHADSFAGLEEVIVTAQKREQSLQDVPISVTAVSGDRMENALVTDSYDLNVVVPNLNMMQALGYVKAFVRGVGASANGPGIESPIATYVDGVYYASAPGSLMSFLDVERVEVLKGPQGTLFGRNATGGLVHVISKAPSHDTQLSAQFTAGNYETYTANLYATGGFSDNVAGSIALQHKDMGEGFGTNVFDGGDTYIYDESTARAKLAIDASDTTSIDLAADYYKRDGDFAYRPILGVDPLFIESADGYSSSPWDTNANASNDVIAETWGASLKIQHDLGWARLMSLTAYRDTEHSYFADVDATPVPVLSFEGGRNGFDDQISQEFQLLSSEESSLQWVAGLYYMDAESSFDPANVYFEPEGPAPFRNFSSNRINGTNTIDSFAIFGETTFSITDTTSITAGIRYTDESNEISATKVLYSAIDNSPRGQVDADQELNFEETTWRLVLDQQLSDEVMVFVSYNRGFKSGGFNLGFPEDTPYDSEILDAYEIGLKSEFGGRLRLNVSAFMYDYDQPQISYVQGGALGVRGVDGSAEIIGLDADVEFVASENLVLFGNIGLLDHEYDEFNNGTGYTFNTVAGGFSQITDPAAQNFSGNSLPQVPDMTATLGGDYGVSTELGEFGVTVNWTYNDGFFTEADNLLSQDSYQMLNANVRWISKDERYNVMLWGKNILDEEVVYQRIAGGFNGLEVYRPPITYGVTLGVDF